MEVLGTLTSTPASEEPPAPTTGSREHVREVADPACRRPLRQVNVQGLLFCAFVCRYQRVMGAGSLYSVAMSNLLQRTYSAHVIVNVYTMQVLM